MVFPKEVLLGILAIGTALFGVLGVFGFFVNRENLKIAPQTSIKISLLLGLTYYFVGSFLGKVGL